MHAFKKFTSVHRKIVDTKELNNLVLFFSLNLHKIFFILIVNLTQKLNITTAEPQGFLCTLRCALKYAEF